MPHLNGKLSRLAVPSTGMLVSALNTSLLSVLQVVLCVLAAMVDAAALDCNGNAISDAEELGDGTAVDCNLNDVPDECDVVPLAFRELGAPRGSGTVRAIFCEDLDGDGLEDLAMGSREGLWVWLASTTGVVEVEGTEFAVEGRARSWALGDLDGDGTVDAVARTGDELLCLLNDGAGNFGVDGPPISIVAVRGTTIAIDDFDGDGTGDIALDDNRNHEVHLVWGDRAIGLHSVGGYPNAVLTGDLDGDGRSDLAVSNRDSATVSILYSRANRSFEIETIPVGEERLEQLVLADLNNDGLLDLATGHSGVASTLLNLGERRFGAPRFFYHEVSRPADFVAGDLDGDGDLDLAGPGSAAFGLKVFWNDGAGRIHTSSDVHFEGAVTALCVADANRDGKSDVVLASSQQEGVVILDATRFEKVDRVTFEARVDYLNLSPSLGREVRPHGVTVGDLDADGAPDVILVNGNAPVVGLLWNDGRGVLTPAAREIRSLAGRLDAAATGDLNGDGDADLVVGGANLLVIENLGQRQFGEPETLPSEGGLHMLVLEDVDRDGALDVLSVYPTSDALMVHWGGGQDGFAETLRLSVAGGPIAVATGDFEADGHVDLAVANAGAGTVSVFTGVGGRNWVRGDDILLASGPTYVVAADFDRNGNIDLATAGSEVQVFLGQGDGGFLRGAAHRVQGTYSMLAADLNNDRAPDLVAANERPGTLAVLLGRGDGTFETAAQLTSTIGVRSTVAVDMDGDGLLDLVSANRQGFDVSVFLRDPVGAFRRAVPFLETICTELDFWQLGRPQRSTPLVELVVEYLLPARDGGALLPTLFQDSERFPRQQEFLEEVFPERFAALETEAYLTLVARRQTRDYFAGSVSRVRTDAGIAYGFNVFVDASDPTQLLSEAEVEGVRRRLLTDFRLEPLGYLPNTAAAREAADSWGETSFPVFIDLDDGEEPPVPEPPMPTPVFTLEIPEHTELCGTFAEAGEMRGLLEEYDLKTTVRLRSGAIALPTVNESIVMGIVDELVFGPEQLRAESLGGGGFQVRRVPLADGVTAYRFTYVEDFLLPDGEPLTFALVAPLIFRARGNDALDGPAVLDEAFFTVNAGDEAFQGTIDGRPLLRYGSCTYAELQLFEIAVTLDSGELAGGGSIRLDERFREAESLLETGPASLTRATIQLGGATRIVTDYWNLVYSALRHNRWAQYRVYLDPPQAVGGLESPVHVVEVRAPEPLDGSREQVFLLGKNLEQLATPRLVTYTKRQRSAAEDVPFRRGDIVTDGRLNLIDAVGLLNYQFSGGRKPDCEKSADLDDSGRVELVDALRLLNFLFREGETPVAPFEACGRDSTPDALDCAAFAPCGA
jgi:hypothetical protein